MAKRLIGAILLFLIISPATGGQDAGEEYIKPGKNLIVEGVPPIPKSLAKLYNEYFKYSYVKLKGWDPVNRELWVQGGTQLVYRMPAPGVNGKIVTPVKFPGFGTYEYFFDRQGKNLIYSRDIDGKELPQLYFWDAETQKSTKLTEDGSRNVEPVWSRRGEWVVWGATPDNADGQDIYIMNPRKPDSLRLLVKSNGYPIQTFDWSADDKYIVCVEYIARKAESKISLFEVSTGKRQLVFPAGEYKKEKVFTTSPKFSSLDGKLFFISNYQSEYSRLILFDIKLNKITYLSNVNWDIEDYAVSPDSKHLAYVVNESGLSKLYIRNIKTGLAAQKIDHSQGVIDTLVWHNNSNDLAFSLQSVNAPGNIYIVNFKERNATCWLNSTLPNSEPDSKIMPEVIKWRSFDKRVISGLIYRPRQKETAPWPVIIEVHGGPEDQARPEFSIDDYIYVNELNVVKINPNIRGSTGYGKTFAALDNGTKRLDALKDIKALLDWIGTQPDLDSSKILVMGYSYGGYMSLLVASSYGARISGAICDSGPSDLATFLEGTSGWRRDLRRYEYGDERDPATRTFLDSISPRKLVDRINKPTLIAFGMNDPRSTPGESLNMITQMRMRGFNVWSVLAKNEGHEFAYPDNRMALFIVMGARAYNPISPDGSLY